MATQVLPPQRFAIASDWDTNPATVQKPAIYDYAYVLGDRAIGTDQVGLIWAVEDHGSKVKWVWTPESPDPVSLDQVDYLLPAYQKHRLRSSTRAIVIYLIVSIGLAFSAIYFHWSAAAVSFIALPLFFITDAIWNHHQAKLFTQADAVAEVSADRFNDWARKKNFTGYSICLFASLFLLAIVEILSSGLDNPTGLIRAAGWQVGTTTGFQPVESNATYAFWNLFLLWWITRAVENTVSPRAVTIVFLPAAVVGSISSLLFFPNASAAGPLAGTIGLMGFLLVAFWLDNKTFPSRFARQLLHGVLLIGLLAILGNGLLPMHFLTPGTLLGGLGTGLFLGWLMLRKHALFRFDSLFKVVGVLSGALLGLIALLAMVQIW